MNPKHKRMLYVRTLSTNGTLWNIEIKEEDESTMTGDIFDVSQSGIMPFWLKDTLSSFLPSLATLVFTRDGSFD